MSAYTRRDFLSDITVLSTGIVGSTIYGCNHNVGSADKPKQRLPGNQGDLCLIFPGAWVFAFDGIKSINAMTHHDPAHLYEWAVSPVAANPAFHCIQLGTSSVTVPRPANWQPKTPKDLVALMAKNGNGFIFTKEVTLADLSARKDLRTINIPMPDAIHEVALTDDNKVDTAVVPRSVLTTMKVSGQITNLPCAYIFRYTAPNWTTATFNDSQSSVVLGTGSGGETRNHFVFRVRPNPDQNAMPPCSAFDRACFARDARHANMTFDSLMSLLNFNQFTKPAIQVPFAGGSLLAKPLPPADVDVDEYGGAVNKELFGVQLANCGASGGFVGGDNPPSR